MIKDIEAALGILSDLGFPLWAIIALIVSYYVITALRRALLTLHDSDKQLQKALWEHVAAEDKRAALLEQIVERHDRAIDSVWQQTRGNP